MERKLPAYLTVYLALTLGVMVTLSLALIEGVRLSTLQLESLCIAEIGMDSAMAEYHRELFRRFDILALDTSYGTRTVGRNNVEARLEFYLSKNMQHKAQETLGGLSEFAWRDFLGMSLEEAELTEVCILTDAEGAAFRKKAVEAVQNDVGAGVLQKVLQWMQTVEEYELDTRDVEAEKRAVDEEIASYEGKAIQISEEEWETLHVENPTSPLETRRKSGIVKQALGDEGVLSGKKLNSKSLWRQRQKDGKINTGNRELQESDFAEAIWEKLWFQEYLMRYLGCYTAVKKDTAIDYELEYTIVGKDADAENLKGVLVRLAAMREAANAAYLFSDETKVSEAELAALGISLLLLTPELKDPIKIAILFGWAYAESVYDVRQLVQGGRVPLMKSSENWHYSLEKILSDLWDTGREEREQEGLSYQDYLRILLFLTDLKELTARAMDLVEADIRLTPGNEAFRLDGCYTEMESRIVIRSGYGYRQTVQTRRSY